MSESVARKLLLPGLLGTLLINVLIGRHHNRTIQALAVNQESNHFCVPLIRDRHTRPVPLHDQRGIRPQQKVVSALTRFPDSEKGAALFADHLKNGVPVNSDHEVRHPRRDIPVSNKSDGPHECSPSVGAGCGDPQPTEGEHPVTLSVNDLCVIDAALRRYELELCEQDRASRYAQKVAAVRLRLLPIWEPVALTPAGGEG